MTLDELHEQTLLLAREALKERDATIAQLRALAELVPRLVGALEKTLLCPACCGVGEVDINDFGGIASKGTMDVCPCCEGEEYNPDLYYGVFELAQETLAEARRLEDGS